MGWNSNYLNRREYIYILFFFLTSSRKSQLSSVLVPVGSVLVATFQLVCSWWFFCLFLFFCLLWICCLFSLMFCVFFSPLKCCYWDIVLLNAVSEQRLEKATFPEVVMHFSDAVENTVIDLQMRLLLCSCVLGIVEGCKLYRTLSKSAGLVIVLSLRLYRQLLWLSWCSVPCGMKGAGRWPFKGRAWWRSWAYSAKWIYSGLQGVRSSNVQFAVTGDAMSELVLWRPRQQMPECFIVPESRMCCLFPSLS